MSRYDPLLSRTDERPDVSLRWDRDRPVAARRGDTVSLALLDAGALETSRSAKYRRPRGAFCLRGDCGTCLVRIDGLPNRRACTTVVRDGLQVQPQNRLVSGPDPSALIDTMMRGDMDHHHFMVRPRVVNQIMQGVARNLTGLGTLPDRAEPDAPARHEEHHPDVLVVGAGLAGRAAVEVLRAAGREVLWIDRLDRAGLVAQNDDDGLDGLCDQTGVFGVYPPERLWAAVTERPGEGAVLRSIAPRHVVVATGARDPTIPLPNNDRPGVVSARGLVEQLRRSGARLRAPAVVIGAGAHAQALARALDRPCIDPAAVERIEGSPVEAVRMRDGSACEARLVALAAPPAPAYELVRQAGASVRWDGHGFAIVRDQAGRCALGPWTVWAAGDVCGHQGLAAGDDGRRVAQALLAASSSSSALSPTP
ncbi:2Fe-2S iron-sulfur cluster-binding protein [Paraliomyxa miuraensis]|uniref:2Fe-2S iron-sulfur cluster-binding protein n=1 Tax=Paraliomyxa miuraensis TaxID=376150 RepID=UPI00225A55CF|nr:2Fe-2S iron-sulfur cluster-binding protein [Paraliomyxa miuraensis]MCX4245925.1 2Fe-2S iron-sulfur cluster-binding protein [Paraliomyxa miuraensis]